MDLIFLEQIKSNSEVTERQFLASYGERVIKIFSRQNWHFKRVVVANNKSYPNLLIYVLYRAYLWQGLFC